MNKQNKIIVGVIALVLALTVGYALFNSSLTINGTAKASGEFNIKFKEVGEIKEVGSKNATASITGANSDTLTVNVPNLEYPTSYVEIPVTVVNDGTIDGKLTGIVVENLETDDIKVTYSGISEGEVFRQKEEKQMLIKITWQDNSEAEVSNLAFQIGLKYQQITVADIESTTSSDSSSFPVVTAQLGDNVFATYDNGNISITGTGDMNNEVVSDDSYCINYIGALGTQYCTLSAEISVKLMEKLKTNNEEINSLLIQLMPLYISGIKTEAIEGKSESEIKESLIENGFSNQNVNDAFSILNTIPNLKSISIGNDITNIRNDFFSSVKIDNITLPKGINKSFVLDGMVLDNFNIEAITETLEKHSIYRSNIKSISLSSNLKRINKNAIESIENLSTLIIPSAVESIENNAIYNCNDLTTIINKTGKAFDWNGILGGTSSNSFETGTVEINGKTITITNK